MIFMGEKIRELRTEKKMTQEQLANRLGLVKGSISAYEQGTKYPSLEVLVMIKERSSPSEANASLLE